MARRVAVVAGLLLAALAMRPVATEEPRADVVIAVGWLPAALDPALEGGPLPNLVLGGLFEGLTRRNAVTGEPVAGQAERWETTEDGTRWVFHLRADARWTDGTPVTAHDFVRGWLHLLDASTASAWALVLYPVRHARAYNTYVEALAALQGHADTMGLLDLIRQRRAGDRAGLATLRDDLVARGLRSPELLGALTDPTTLALIQRTGPGLSPPEAEYLQESLEAEATRMETELGRAREHFGKDEGVYAVDDRSLVVELTAFTPWFLKMTALSQTCPRHAAAEGGAGVAGSAEKVWAVSNGPYLVSHWNPKKRLKLRRNPAYWGVADVRAKTIEVLVEEDETRQVEAFRAGNVDWLPNLSEVAAGGARGRLKNLYAAPVLATYFLRVNCTRAPFSDPRVRRALALAVDRVALATEAGAVPHTALHHVVPWGLPGYLPPESGVSHDPAEARRLLAEAGFPGGKGFPVVDYFVNVGQGHQRIAESLAKMMDATLGIRLRVRTAEWPEFDAATRRRDYDLARGGWVLDDPDPLSALAMWTTGSPENRTGWGDARYDQWVECAADVFALLDASAGEVDALVSLAQDPDGVRAAIQALRVAKEKDRLAAAQALRLAFLREAESILVLEAFPVVPLYQYMAYGAVSPDVEGVHAKIVGSDGQQVPNVEDVHPLRDVFVRR